MAEILVTGFEPFGGLTYNPSAAALDLLPSTLLGHVVHKVVLPVDHQLLPDLLHTLYRVDPVLILHLGLAQSRPCLTLERRGQNRMDFDIPDNGNRLVQGQKVVETGPEELPVRFPVDVILRTLAQKQIPAQESHSAGTYLCNQALYLSLYDSSAAQVGFIHLAPDESFDGPHQPLRQQADAIAIALSLALGGELA